MTPLEDTGHDAMTPEEREALKRELDSVFASQRDRINFRLEQDDFYKVVPKPKRMKTLAQMDGDERDDI